MGLDELYPRQTGEAAQSSRLPYTKTRMTLHDIIPQTTTPNPCNAALYHVYINTHRPNLGTINLHPITTSI
jgi:hypothetical protein